MVRALRVMTVERGVDPRGLALLAFGGAGALHAAAIAEELGMTRILCPRTAGVLAALGLVVSDRRRDVQRSVLLSGDALTGDAVRAEVARLGGGDRVVAELRYRGQAFELAVEAEPDDLREAFAAAHEQAYGFRDPGGEVELVTLRVTTTEPGPEIDPDAAGAAARGATTSRRRALARRRGARGHGAHRRARPGHADHRPRDRRAARGHARRPARLGGRRPALGHDPAGPRMSIDPVTLRVVSGALRAACEEMGAVLIRASHSANIKERRDASCALFDPEGRMVMQAEHIPVHLGAMPAAVEAVTGEEHRPGVSWVLNDPYRGGTHLPDITVITPAFGDGGELLGFAANRAHHADVGGPTPGSMPADSTTLAEEGVVIPPRVLDAATVEELVAQMRQPAQRRADLRAQLAANRTGVERLRELHGRADLAAAMTETIGYAERRMRACLRALPDGTRRAEDVLEAREGDLVLTLAATVAGDELTLDFTGSAAQHEGNLNCPLSVTRSACWFAVRVLTDPDIPPTAGASRPITVIAPEGSILNARPPAAVVAGNVETSSRVADLVLAAFGHALGQGTMNNVTLGTDDFTYYETLGGGQGACADAPGPSGVHVAMSNTRNTPVEALELEFPLRVREYAIRRGSGGAGAQRGGDGVVRELEALAPMGFSLLTERRRHAPPGAAGGGPGARGRNLLDGTELPPKARGSLAPGQTLRIETPGGGGHGE